MTYLCLQTLLLPYKMEARGYRSLWAWRKSMQGSTFCARASTPTRSNGVKQAAFNCRHKTYRSWALAFRQQDSWLNFEVKETCFWFSRKQSWVCYRFQPCDWWRVLICLDVQRMHVTMVYATRNQMRIARQILKLDANTFLKDNHQFISRILAISYSLKLYQI